ncbi:uncharacterized protein LOC135652348 [Musa acuminata AAA Group]|uniref:uncharacterized protein LOC135652348 n=1 Tax=Musa acuminata AAA Group TaxID=214697 RepID=UPI0031DC6C01
MGDAEQNSKGLEAAMRDLALITGQRPVKTKAKKSIASFKLREGATIGIAVTLRGNVIYSFLDRLVNLGLPRTRDFQGVTSGNCSAVALRPSRLGPSPEGGGLRVGEPLESTGSPKAAISEGFAPAQRSGRGARPDPSDDPVSQRCGGGLGGGKTSVGGVMLREFFGEFRGIYRRI